MSSYVNFLGGRCPHMPFFIGGHMSGGGGGGGGGWGGEMSYTLLHLLRKMHLKMLSAKVICCIKMLMSRNNFSIQSNSVDPDQTSPLGAV